MVAYILIVPSVEHIFWYAVPILLEPAVYVGVFVRVPLQNRQVYGLVLEISEGQPSQKFKVKDIISVCTIPKDTLHLLFLRIISNSFYVALGGLALKLLGYVKIGFIHSRTYSPVIFNHALINDLVMLTGEQQKIVDFVVPFIKDQKHCALLLHGVTGSGKTEVYKKLMIEALSCGQIVLFLLPEISLALGFLQRLRVELLHVPIFSLHSATAAEEKKIVWEYLVRKEPCIIIGVHIPVYLPISNLGLIIVDEEHELGYWEKKLPKLNTKLLALVRAQLAHIPIIFGSATPSMYALHEVKMKRWYFFQLTKRFGGTLPQLELVSLKEKNNRPYFWISRELEAAIAQCLTRNEQVLIFLNRRGYAFFVQCSSCGFIPQCNNCSVSLTFHQPHTLICHYCNFSVGLNKVCKGCSKTDGLLTKGIGTQKIVEILQKLFPIARIARADLDTTLLQKKWQVTYQAFVDKKIDILVGTQTIVKGHHFPGVTLVGVIWADMNFHIPVFYATEVAIQQLIQVAGRAGRIKGSSGKVIMQSIDSHDNFNYLNELDYLQLYRREIENRRLLLYPPVGYLAEIICVHKNEAIVIGDSESLVLWLQNTSDSEDVLTILGPTIPLVSQIKKYHYRVIFIKSMCQITIQNLLIKTFKVFKNYKSKLYIQIHI